MSTTVYEMLCLLLPSQFEEVVFRVGAPSHALSGPQAPLGVRALELVRWAETAGKEASVILALPDNLRARVNTVTTKVTQDRHEETPNVNLNERPIHPAHHAGFRLLVRDTLVVTEDTATQLLRRIFRADVTYAELPNLGEKAITRAVVKVCGTDHDIPETSVDELIVAIRGVTPERRYCEGCGRLDLVRKAGRWVPVSQNTCLFDQKVYVAVAFPRPIRAWTDHQMYDPDVEMDSERLPIQEGGLRAYLAMNGGGIHPWVREALQRVDGTFSLIDFADYLLWQSGMHANPQSPAAKVAVLRSLVDPSSYAFDSTGVRVQVEKALKLKGAVVADTGGKVELVGIPGANTSVTPTRAQIRKLLTRLFPTRTARMLASDAGLNTSRIAFGGTDEDTWASILEEAQKAGKLDNVYRVALQEYPTSAELRALLGSLT